MVALPVSAITGMGCMNQELAVPRVGCRYYGKIFDFAKLFC